MSLTLKKCLVYVLVLGKNLREYSRTLVTRTLKGVIGVNFNEIVIKGNEI